MPPKKAAAPKAHESAGMLTFYAGSVIVFASAGLSYVLAQAGDEPLTAATKMWLMNAALCLVASWLTWDHSWRVHALAVFERMRVRSASCAALTRRDAARSDRVDRLWSVTPIFYVVHFAHAASWAPRPALMAGLALAWGLRLSWNFARKAGYQARAPCRPARAVRLGRLRRAAAQRLTLPRPAAQVGEEDYRWPELQRKMKAFSPNLFPVLWQVFNVTFICLYQHVLLLLIALPAWVAQQSSAPLNALDVAAAALFLALLVLESVADQQQWIFQQSKRKLLPQRCVPRMLHDYAMCALKMRMRMPLPRRAYLKADYGRGFLTQGLFAYSRHPNFFAEQSMWWAFYLFAVAAKGGLDAGRDAWLQPVLVGPVLLSLLFQGSTPFTEDITVSKYPGAYGRATQCSQFALPRSCWCSDWDHLHCFLSCR